MGNAYHTVPTSELVAMWERRRDSILNRDDGPTLEDCAALYEMRRELDRRKDEPRPVVDVNFSSEYLTD